MIDVASSVPARSARRWGWRRRVTGSRSSSSRRVRARLPTSARSRFRTPAASSWRACTRGRVRPRLRSRSIHVSQHGGPGRTLIDAADQGLAALGYTVPYGALEARPRRTPGRARNCSALRRSPANRSRSHPMRAHLKFASGHEVQARLLVLADGGANAAKIPGIAFHEKDYGQLAVVGAVATDQRTWRARLRALHVRAVRWRCCRSRIAMRSSGPRRRTRARALVALDEARIPRASCRRAFGDRAGRFVSIAGRGILSRCGCAR